jgi:hypothetical protein
MGATATGTGFTVMVNVLAGPSHETPPLVKRGVTVMVATTGCVPLLVPVNGIKLPVPVAASPMVGSLFVQVYVVTPTLFVVVKFTIVVVVPWQISWLAGWFTCGTGFTFTV